MRHARTAAFVLAIAASFDAACGRELIREGAAAPSFELRDTAGKAFSTREIAARAMEEFGRIDTLVNCAGVNKRMKAEAYTPEVYDYITNINIRGAFFMVR